ncbi:MAG TPA: glucosyl-3-phosphoglycerate synthase [Acidimicrobiia bacterium]|nr:glucosyl-3-phosphoglycerate synthase [Acidimicrobiia bacterium]
MSSRGEPAPVSPDRALYERAKRAAGVSVSVCLPARDEAATIGSIVAAVRAALVDDIGLVDEVVVIDDTSSDETAAIAGAAGARVVAESAILPEAGRGSGKGNVLWKSLHECRGDVICWLDADLRNFDPSFVAGLVLPLLLDPAVEFVKGFYRRPYGDEPTGGGRVTELVARPLLSLLFPKLADIVQPLGGEYAARRRAVESVPFVEGWGVELGLLVDIVERFGRDAVVQVDLGVREHRNRTIDELAPQAMAVLATALRRAGLYDAHGSVELARVADDYALFTESIETAERPPIITFDAYRARFGRDSRASS